MSEGLEGIEDLEDSYYEEDDQEILDPGPLQCEKTSMRETEIKLDELDKNYRVSKKPLIAFVPIFSN